jgi:hypothetical protein
VRAADVVQHRPLVRLAPGHASRLSVSVTHCACSYWYAVTSTSGHRHRVPGEEQLCRPRHPGHRLRVTGADATVTGEGDRIDSVEVGGSALIVAEGWFRVAPA